MIWKAPAKGWFPSTQRIYAAANLVSHVAALLSLGQQKKAECGGVGGAGQASIFGGKELLRTLVVAIVVPVSRHSSKRLLPGR